MTIYDTREGTRLAMSGERKGPWNRWGPYLAERACGRFDAISMAF